MNPFRANVWRRWAGLPLALLLAGAAIGEDPNPPSIHSDKGAWPIRRQWNVAETHHFAKWINTIYRVKSQGTMDQRRAKLIRTLTDPEMNLLLDPEFAGAEANPQLPESLMYEMHRILDCGKLTVALSTYYSYRRALPWMMTYVRSGGGDVRTSPRNIPSGELNSFTAPSLEYFVVNAVRGFNTGNYRVEPFGERHEQSDTVPVAIDPRYLIPGAMHYLDGHVLVLADIDKHGELRFVDATTAASRDIYTFNGLNAVMGIPPKRSENPGREYAGCFQGLRIFRYPIAEVDETGEVLRVRRRTDEEMKEFGYSTEQYDKIEEITKTGRIMENGLPLESFHELIQARLRTVDRVSPVEFMNAYADELIDLFRMREAFVQDAWRDVNAHGPITYPENSTRENIFTADGRWGQWTSASTDVDIRSRYYYLADWMDNVIRWYDRKPEFVDLTGLDKYYLVDRGNLARALVAEKDRIFRQRVMHYTNSAGQRIALTLLDVERRLYDLSFDPNHPPELRWGAKPGMSECALAVQVNTPLPDGKSIAMMEAYRCQAYYRALCQRETTESYLSGMFTEGFPTREKFEGQLAKWLPTAEPVPPLVLAEVEAEYDGIESPYRLRPAPRSNARTALNR
ncbi:MAG: hypothetical protein AMXMBFR4_11400 [Candidatus Hydrogenedentota bacterium]